jgi:phosphatidylinositol-3-phosphatase
MRSSEIVKVLLISSVVLTSTLFSTPIGSTIFGSSARGVRFGPPSSAPFDHIVTILMENQGLCAVYTGCGGSATYQSQLADQNTLVMTWGTIDHNSEPNYIALLGAVDDTNTKNDGVCCYFEPGLNIIDRIEGAGLGWQAWAEDAGSSGTCSFSPPRNGDHFPFIDFSDMQTNSRCSQFTTTASNTSPISGSCSSPNSNADPEFLASLTANAPNFIWLTPNDCDNGHDSSVSFGDQYLSLVVPKILASPLFTYTSSKATLLILYDEGYTACNNTGGTGECVYASFSGPAAKKGQQISPANASHYSYLSMIEAAWGLSSINQNDAGAPNMMSAFGACTTNCTTSPPPGGGSPGAFLGLSTSSWLIIIAGLVGLVAALAVITIRVRARAKKARQLSAN